MEIHYNGKFRRWAWSQIDKENTGEVSPGDIARMALRYNAHVSETGDVVRLIKRCDTNEDKDLDVQEISELLEVISLLE